MPLFVAAGSRRVTSVTWSVEQIRRKTFQWLIILPGMCSSCFYGRVLILFPLVSLIPCCACVCVCFLL